MEAAGIVILSAAKYELCAPGGPYAGIEGVIRVRR
jgi:hypothetical protein